MGRAGRRRARRSSAKAAASCRSGLLLDEALGRLGIRPDLAAGHSLGEWTGQIVSGQIPTSYVDEFLDSLQPGSIEVSDVVFVALGAGADVAAELVDGLADAYVSHDNCPHQSVICAPAASMAVAVERAKERKVLAQELPFRSGFHSPLFAPFVASMGEQFAGIPLAVPERADVVGHHRGARTPTTRPASPSCPVATWSSRCASENWPSELYAEGVRTFVQVGTGSLLGFIDDTLRDRDILTISANTAKQTGVDQLRRVAAALWSTGRDVDFAPLGHAVDGGPSGAGGPTSSPSAPQRLVLGSTLIRDLTPLDRPVASPVDPADWADLDVPAPIIDEYRESVAEASAAARRPPAARDSKPQSTKPYKYWNPNEFSQYFGFFPTSPITDIALLKVQSVQGQYPYQHRVNLWLHIVEK